MQDSINIKNDKFAKVDFYAKTKHIELVWKTKAVRSEDYRQVFLDILEFTKNNDFSFFLTDIRNLGVVSPNDRKWLQQIAFKQAVEQGLTKAAVILEGNPFKTYHMNILLKFVTTAGMKMKVFTNYDKAKNWLLE